MAKRNNSVGRPKTFKREEILELAMFHFWEHGYDGTNLDELLTSMGIKKSSFYRTFKSKEEVFSLSLDLYRHETFALIRDLRKRVGTKQALMEIVKLNIDQLETEGKVRGCLLMSFGKECYMKHPALSHKITVEFDAFLVFFTSFIEEAQAKHEISNTIDAKKIAIRYLTIFNGVVAMLQAGANIEEMEESLEMVEALLV